MEEHGRDDVRQSDRLEEEWEAVQWGDEEDLWAGVDMDEAEEPTPGTSANAESRADIPVDPEEELNEQQEERGEGDEGGDAAEWLSQKVTTRRRKVHRERDRKKCWAATWLQRTSASAGGGPNRR